MLMGLIIVAANLVVIVVVGTKTYRDLVAGGEVSGVKVAEDVG